MYIDMDWTVMKSYANVIEKIRIRSDNIRKK